MIRIFTKYIYTALLSAALLSAGCGGETSQSDSKSEWMYVTAKSGLRLRAEPSTTGTKMALIPPATRVEVLERSESTLVVDNIEAPWVKVRHQGLEGWVFGGYLGSESQGGAARTSQDQVFVGVWEGANLCEGSRSRLEIRADGTFEANLFGGCDVTACLCGPATGEYRIEDGRVCFTVKTNTFEIVRRDSGPVCYQLKAGSLVAAQGASAFYENYGSEILTGLKRATDAKSDSDSESTTTTADQKKREH